jgi:hypothetical protein
MSRIAHNIDVSIVGQFTLLSTSNLFVRIRSTVPQSRDSIHQRDHLYPGSVRILDVPLTARTLKGMGPDLCPRHLFAIRSREETNYSVTVTRLVHSGFQKRSSAEEPAAGWFSFSISRVSFSKVLPPADAFLREAKDMFVFSVLNV